MPRATVVLMIYLFTTLLLNLAGYDSVITSLDSFFSSTTASCSAGSFSLLGCLSRVATVATPVVIVAYSLLSGNSGFAVAAAYLILPLITIPYELFTTAIVPVEVKFLMAGFFAILTGMAGIAILSGDV